jgi:hypothetical protein
LGGAVSKQIGKTEESLLFASVGKSAVDKPLSKTAGLIKSTRESLVSSRPFKFASSQVARVQGSKAIESLRVAAAKRGIGTKVTIQTSAKGAAFKSLKAPSTQTGLSKVKTFESKSTFFGDVGGAMTKTKTKAIESPPITPETIGKVVGSVKPTGVIIKAPKVSSGFAKSVQKEFGIKLQTSKTVPTSGVKFGKTSLKATTSALGIQALKGIQLQQQKQALSTVSKQRITLSPKEQFKAIQKQRQLPRTILTTPQITGLGSRQLLRSTGLSRSSGLGTPNLGLTGSGTAPFVAPFFLPGSKKAKSSRSTGDLIDSEFNPQYAPSVEAIIFDIRGPKPKDFKVSTGLDLRPLPTTKKRSKR